MGAVEILELAPKGAGRGSGASGALGEGRARTFCTWLISSCLRFWLRVILRSGCSASSLRYFSEFFCTASFTVLVSASRFLSTHSSSRRLTVRMRHEGAVLPPLSPLPGPDTPGHSQPT